MKQIIQYRLHVIFGTYLLTLLSFPTINLQSTMLALAMAMVMAFVFLFNKTTDLLEDNINTASYPIEEGHRSILSKIAYACLIIPLSWLWRTPEILTVYLVCGGVLGFLYSYPIRIGKETYRLKNIFLVKNLTSAISLTACTCLPSYFLYSDLPHIYLLMYASSIFFMILNVEIICDIRDIDGDRQAGIMTLPNTLGVALAKTIAILIFAGYCLWFYHLTSFVFFKPSPLIFVAQAATLLIILFTTKTRPYWYFHLPIFLGIAFCLANMIMSILK